MVSLIKILKETNPQSGELEFSQGRIYLLTSVIAYYVTLGVLLINGTKNSDVDPEKFTMIVKALEFSMVLFAGYVFGGKIVDIFKIIKG